LQQSRYRPQITCRWFYKIRLLLVDIYNYLFNFCSK